MPIDWARFRMKVALFEDGKTEIFSPLTLTKACFDVNVGARTCFELYKNAPEILVTRKYLRNVTAERHPNCQVNPASVDPDTALVNGFMRPDSLDLGKLAQKSHTFVLASSGKVLAARLSRSESEKLIESAVSGRKVDVKHFRVEKIYELTESNASLLFYPWTIISNLENSLANQVAASNGSRSRVQGRLGESAPIIDGTAEIEDGVVFDTTKGGVFVGRGAKLCPSRIVGPTIIGERTLIKQFSIIESSYIGSDCRIGGEVEHSIICDYTNKAHLGFVGHSYVGEWVNLGAQSTTSDLKLTYGDIKMKLSGRRVSTGMNKLGVFIGDMVKSSIGTLIHGGLRIGISSHISGLVSQDIPSFTIFAASGKRAELELESAIRTQSRMMTRRNRTMTNAYKKLIEYVFTRTAEERKKSGARRVRLFG